MKQNASTLSTAPAHLHACPRPLTLASCLTSISTTSSWFFSEATCRGVWKLGTQRHHTSHDMMTGESHTDHGTWTQGVPLTPPSPFSLVVDVGASPQQQVTHLLPFGGEGGGRAVLQDTQPKPSPPTSSRSGGQIDMLGYATSDSTRKTKVPL